jgi:hypothetical protein
MLSLMYFHWIGQLLKISNEIMLDPTLQGVLRNWGLFWKGMRFGTEELVLIQALL